MLHYKLLETVASHTNLLDKARARGIDWNDTLQVYAIIHALQIHAQAVIDYLLHTCALMGVSLETPIHCINELEHKNILNSNEAEMLRRLTRFRNIVVHEYGSIEISRVKKILEDRGYHLVLSIIHRIHGNLENSGLIGP